MKVGNDKVGVMDMNIIVPVAPDRCLCIFDFYFSDAGSKNSKAFVKRSMAVADQVQKEDLTICENVQAGLNSRFYSAGPYSERRESGVHHFHKLLGSRLREKFEQWSRR